MTMRVYQLKVALRGVDPSVWRRILIPGDATVRTLHETVQVVMGWSNCHLHRFTVHGREYGLTYEGGISFADRPDKVRLSEFHFQPHERFEYVYDFGDRWEHDILVEKILPLEPARAYPVCIRGAQSRQPEDSGGPWQCMSRRRAKIEWNVRSSGTEGDAGRFDPKSENVLLRNIQERWLRRFDELK
jgi:Plasmid pRiA4b ORF-3-like protein